ncbi:MAG TPA: winged helix-turn-helix domain-containing protein [Candidatus Acidoferrum sp.]
MRGDDSSLTTLAFGDFRLDARGQELRKNGMRIRLRQQPAQVLTLLARHAGEIVTREELQRELWGADTFVDFERGLNNCIKQIREALNDDPANPKYVETIPRQGYRFTARVESEPGSNGESAVASVTGKAAPPESAAARQTAEGKSTELSKGRKLARFWGATLAGVLAIAGTAAWMFIGRPAFSFHERDWVLVGDFENHTGDPRFDDALLTAFTVSLEQSRYANILPRGRIDSALKRMGKPGAQRVTTEIGREICQREGVRALVASNITRTGQEYALTAELIDPATGAAVRSYSERANGEDHVLDALDKIAASVRADLGESLYQIHHTSRPLPQVTTSSLSALKEYSDAVSLWRSQKYDEAMGLYRGAIALDPDFAMAHANLGSAYCSHVYNYQRDRCAQEFEKALALSSRTTEREQREIQMNYAGEMGHVKESEQLYRFYLQEYPDDWAACSRHARFLRTHAQWEEAIEQYREILRIAPSETQFYLDIATAYKSLGKPAEAIQAYSEAFRLNPAYLKISNLNREYGFALVAHGEEAKAEQVFSALCADRDSRGSCLHSLALLDLMHGRYASARERFTEALSLAEQDRNSFLITRNHFFLAVVASGQENKAKQIKELDAALSDFKDLGPKVDYGSLVGQEYARAGAVEKAEQIEKRIAPLVDPNSDEQTGYLHLLQGEIALARGDALGAAGLFDLQDSRYGDSVKALSIEALGRAYQKAGTMDQEVSWYERLFAPSECHLVGWEPQQRCVEARLGLASTYLGRGDKQKAASTLAPLMRDWKDADTNLPLKKRILALQSRVSNSAAEQLTAPTTSQRRSAGEQSSSPD